MACKRSGVRIPYPPPLRTKKRAEGEGLRKTRLSQQLPNSDFNVKNLMRKIIGIALILSALALTVWDSVAFSRDPKPVAPPGLQQTPAQAAPIPIIRLTGEVDFFMVQKATRLLRQAAKAAPPFVVLDLDVTGGQLEPTLKILAELKNLPKESPPIAFVNHQATGYGLLIALTCQRILATDQAVLGRCPPLAYDAKATKSENSGFRLFLMEKLEVLCKKGGYDPELAKAMVDRSMVVLRKEGGLEVQPTRQEEPNARHTPVVAAKPPANDPGVVADQETLLELTGEQIQGAGFTGPLLKDRGDVAQALGQPESKLITLSHNILGRAGANQKVAVIDVEGTVDYGLAKYVERALVRAKDQGATAIIFRMSTWGGSVGAGLDIQKDMLETDAVTLSYVEDKAISAGALTGLASDHIIMRMSSTLGDCEPIYQTSEGIQTAPEKIQTVLRERFRTNAQNREGQGVKFPVLLAEAMVTKEMQVHRILTPTGIHYKTTEELEKESKESVVIYDDTILTEKGKLPTFNATEAYRLGFATYVAKDFDDFLARYEIPQANVTHIEITWSEEMVRFLNSPTITGILFMVGLVALWTEFKVPGFGLPGIVGLLCFAVLFTSKYMVDLADAIEIVLFVIGVILLTLEIFVIPGFGIAGVSGLLLIVASLILSMQSFVIPTEQWQVFELKANALVLAISFLCALVLFLILIRFLPKTPIFNQLVLATAQTSEGGFTAAVAEEVSLVGRVGVVITSLRPAGKAEFDGKPFTVTAEGDFIEKGTQVKVIKTEGNRILVTRA